MRVAGICTSQGGAVARFLDSMFSTLEAAEQQRLRALTFPSANPVVGALVAKNGHPPVQCASRPDGSFAILDGEMYNAADLPTADATPRNNDADRILALYFSAGQDAIARVDAAATVAIWDARRERLVLFRDRRGVVPGYYDERHNGIVWASDIGSLIRIDRRRWSLNLAALDFFLGNGFVPAPWTLVEQITKIPPAHVVVYRPVVRAPVSLRRYWRPASGPKLKQHAGQTTEDLRQLFERALRRRSSADQRTGVLLSGGVDSRLIIAGLSKLMRVPVHTFTFRYTDYNGRFNELEEARRTAEHFHTQHHEIEFQPGDIVENLEWMLRSYGEPFTYGLHTCILRDVVDMHVSVLFSGAGADSLYLTKRETQALRFALLPRALRALAGSSVPLLRRLNAMSRPLWLWRVYHGAGDLADEAEAVMWCADRRLPESFSGMIIPHEFRSSYYRDRSWLPDAHLRADSLFTTAIEDFVGESEEDKMTFLKWHFRSSEGTLHWNHWWGRAHGLAIRFPYVDNELCDFELRLPRESVDKEDLRRLATEFMPQDMAYGPKVPQTVPIGHWFRGPLKDFLHEQLAPARVKGSGLFNDEVVQKSLSEHSRGRNDHGWKLWAILTVLVWEDVVLRGTSKHAGWTQRSAIPNEGDDRRGARASSEHETAGSAGVP